MKTHLSKSLRLPTLVGLSALSFVVPAHSGASGYQCTIFQEQQLLANGTLGKPLKVSLLGKRFAVDRQTGTIVEPDGAHWVFGGAETRVVSSGNEENSFQLLITAPARNKGVFLTALRVEEFADTKVKPFLLTSGPYIYAGVCE